MTNMNYQKILIIHRQNENIDYIRMACKTFGTKAVSLHDDEKNYRTIDKYSWLRDCVTGYDIDGNHRYTHFVVLGRYLDETCRDILAMISQASKPLYALTGGKLTPIQTQSTVPCSDGISEIVEI